MRTKGTTIDPKDSYALQRLAREEMKTKLLTDILTDMTICQLEGWDVLEYAQELHEMIDSITNKKKP